MPVGTIRGGCPATSCGDVWLSWWTRVSVRWKRTKAGTSRRWFSGILFARRDDSGRGVWRARGRQRRSRGRLQGLLGVEPAQFAGIIQGGAAGTTNPRDLAEAMGTTSTPRGRRRVGLRSRRARLVRGLRAAPSARRARMRRRFRREAQEARALSPWRWEARAGRRPSLPVARAARPTRSRRRARRARSKPTRPRESIESSSRGFFARLGSFRAPWRPSRR
jgi:hypothetical protein